MDSIALLPETVKAVENYLHLGWSLIPVCAPFQGGCKHHTQCDKPDKRSLVYWKKLQRKPPTAHQVRAWFKKWPDANVGVLTGSASGIAVLDVDTDDAEMGPMELTPRSLTGRGQHNFFQWRRHLRSQRIGESLEIKADGSYVVLPNSNHPSGTKYVWVVSPWELDGQLAEIPDWLECKLRENPNHEKRPIAEIVKGVPDGIRNNSATQVAGWIIGLANPSQWENRVWPLLVGWNKLNKPQLALVELRVIYESICKRELSKRLKSEPDNALQRILSAALTTFSFRQLSNLTGISKSKLQRLNKHLPGNGTLIEEKYRNEADFADATVPQLREGRGDSHEASDSPRPRRETDP